MQIDFNACNFIHDHAIGQSLIVAYSFFPGVLVNLHHSNGNIGDCGLINIDAIQQVVAAKWAVDVINNQSLPHELRIGRSTSTQIIFSHVLPRYCQTRPRLLYTVCCALWTIRVIS